MNYALLTDELLVKLLQAGDELSLKEIYSRYWKTLFQDAYYRVRSTDLAKEIVQSVFIRIWEKRESLNILHIEAYLRSALKNTVINYIQSRIVEKKYQHFKSQVAQESGRTADEPLLLQELSLAIRNAIAQLPEKTRHIFCLSRFENLSAKEIARQMELSEKAVEYHITKSLKVMRLYLKDYIFFLVLAASFLKILLKNTSFLLG